MSNIEILLNEQNELAFDISIEGIELSSSEIDVRFVVENQDMDLSFKGIIKEDTVTVNIPILSKIMSPDSYNTRLEFVLAGEKFFIPMKESIDFIQPVKVAATITKNTKSEKKSKVKESISGPITVKVGLRKTLNEKVEENLNKFAGAQNLDELLGIYKKEVVSESNVKDALHMIDMVCENTHGVSFKEYVKESK